MDYRTKYIENNLPDNLSYFLDKVNISNYYRKKFMILARINGLQFELNSCEIKDFLIKMNTIRRQEKYTDSNDLKVSNDFGMFTISLLKGWKFYIFPTFSFKSVIFDRVNVSKILLNILTGVGILLISIGFFIKMILSVM